MDECVEPRWRSALSEAGYDVRRVKSVDELGEEATDEAVLSYAVTHDALLLTADRSDFTDPPRTDHSGIVVVSDRQNPSGADVVVAVERVREAYPAGGFVAYVSDWA